MTIAQIITTSCSRRELELEQMRDFLLGNGIDVSDDEWNVNRKADLIFLSTCGFTHAAEDFGFETLNRIYQQKKESAEVIMCGCIPDINPQRVQAEFAGRFFGPTSYSRLDDMVAAARPFASFPRPNVVRSRGTRTKENVQKAVQLLKAFDGSYSGLQYIVRKASNAVIRKTFYIQIQEGCSMDCAYCVIKTAIGKLRSRPIDAILLEFKHGLDLGYKQFQLVGDNAGGYGLDIGTNFGTLLTAISQIDADYRLDITDINPAYLQSMFGPLCDLLAAGRVSRLYVPVQSGSTRILKLMRRPSDVNGVKDMLKRLKCAAPSGESFRLGTSLIVGFPSETAEDLQETINFCKDVRFDWVWCHSFSARPETPAAKMGGQIESDEILRRARLVKKELSGYSYVTTAADSAGSRTCQG